MFEKVKMSMYDMQDFRRVAVRRRSGRKSVSGEASDLLCPLSLKNIIVFYKVVTVQMK